MIRPAGAGPRHRYCLLALSLVLDGPLGSAAIAELGESARCEHPDGTSFITCQAKHGDTVGFEYPRHGPYRALVDAQVARTPTDRRRFCGPAIACLGSWARVSRARRTSDVSFEAGRAWARAPVVTELRLGGNLGAGQIELTRRVARSPQCTGSSGARPA